MAKDGFGSPNLGCFPLPVSRESLREIETVCVHLSCIRLTDAQRYAELLPWTFLLVEKTIY